MGFSPPQVKLSNPINSKILNFYAKNFNGYMETLHMMVSELGFNLGMTMTVRTEDERDPTRV